MVYIYISPSSQKEKMKQKKGMNIFHLAHISISIFCRSHLFSVDAASYFLVVRHRLSFFCARDRKFRKKKHKKNTREGETTHFFPYVCLHLISWSSEHTHSVFLPRLRSYIIRTNKKKTHWWKMFVRSHAYIKKKKEGYTIESRLAAVTIRINTTKKSEKKKKCSYTYMYNYLSVCLSRARAFDW
jgi:hypothetical protein